jgi:hypothetical protein
VTRFSVMLNAIVENIARPSCVVLPLIAIRIVLESAPPNLRARAFVAHLLVLLLIAACTWLVMRAVSAVIRLHPATVDLLQRECPEALPRLRGEIAQAQAQAPGDRARPAPPPLKPGRGDSSAIREPTHTDVRAERDARSPAESRG